MAEFKVLKLAFDNADERSGWSARRCVQKKIHRSIAEGAHILAIKGDRPGGAHLVTDVFVHNRQRSSATWETLLDSIPGVERRILEFRAELVSTLSARAYAGYEEQLATGTQSPVSSWRSVGEFVVDAVTGMLTAPQTHPG